YLPDEILIVDHMRQTPALYRYKFEAGGTSTDSLPRNTRPDPYRLDLSTQGHPSESVHAPGQTATLVDLARSTSTRPETFSVPGVAGPLSNVRMHSPSSSGSVLLDGCTEGRQTISRATPSGTKLSIGLSDPL